MPTHDHRWRRLACFIAAVFPRRLGQWSGPLIVAAVLAGLAAITLAGSGWINLTASTPDWIGAANFLHFTFKRSVAHHADGIVVPPEVYGDRLVRKGALVFAQECSHCHGAPGLRQNPVALAMSPAPQYLVARKDVFTPAELFWIVKHGVKYGAMPAWPAQSRDDEVWAMVAFVNRLHALSPADYRAMTAPPLASAATADRLRTPGAAATGGLQPAVPFGEAAGGVALNACTACHGIDGRGRPGTGIPNIALLPRDYIKAQLVAFASGKRPSGFMQPVAAALTDAQMDEVADYYSAQPKARAVASRVDTRLVAQGEAIIAGRAPGTKAAACSACHGEQGASPVGFSRLAGQHPAYLRDQLRLFRRGGRTIAQPDQMSGAAHGMSDTDIDAVSWAYAVREPGRLRP